MREQGVDHDVADHEDRRLRRPLPDGGSRRHPLTARAGCGHTVGDEPVDLLGHGAVERLRSPASTCATGTPSLAATRAAARVELTSPTTTTMSGRSSSTTRSKRTITAAVCSACDPVPTSRSRSGPRQAQLFEEDVGHRAGRSAARCGRGAATIAGYRRERRDDRRDLHEVRPRADDVHDLGHRPRCYSTRRPQ